MALSALNPGTPIPLKYLSGFIRFIIWFMEFSPVHEYGFWNVPELRGMRVSGNPKP